VHAIKDGQAVCAGSEDAKLCAGGKIMAAGHVGRVELFAEVGEAHAKSRQRGAGGAAPKAPLLLPQLHLLANVRDAQHTQRRFDHAPYTHTRSSEQHSTRRAAVS
jgi:hypothetical protein